MSRTWHARKPRKPQPCNPKQNKSKTIQKSWQLVVFDNNHFNRIADKIAFLISQKFIAFGEIYPGDDCDHCSTMICKHNKDLECIIIIKGFPSAAFREATEQVVGCF